MTLHTVWKYSPMSPMLFKINSVPEINYNYSTTTHSNTPRLLMSISYAILKRDLVIRFSNEKETKDF